MGQEFSLYHLLASGALERALTCSRVSLQQAIAREEVEGEPRTHYHKIFVSKTEI
jgi:hypothetical protein